MNTASGDGLAKLPGLGRGSATRIVAYRQAHGPFESIDHLERVPGMTRVTLNRVRDVLSTE